MQPSLFLGRDGRVKSPRDVPADNAADNGPLADALRGAAASQPCRVMQSAHKTHVVILRGCDAFSIGGFGAKTSGRGAAASFAQRLLLATDECSYGTSARRAVVPTHPETHRSLEEGLPS